MHQAHMHSDERHLDASYGCQRLVLMGFAWGTARIMNAVEIEEAISSLAEQPFDGDEFPFAFLTAFGIAIIGSGVPSGR